MHVTKENFTEIEVDEEKKKSVHFQVKGVANAGRITKPIQKTYSDVDLGVEKYLSTYTPRDTLKNLGLKMGIDIRKISSGLGHSSVEITEKHYSQMIQEKILDEINAQITKAPSPS
jgi:integrase